MEAISFLSVLVVAVVFFIIGFIWHGPLFGKIWARAMGMDMNSMTPEQKKEMQKKMWPAYILQLILSIVTAYVLAVFIGSGIGGALAIAFWLWLGFSMPMAASAALWSGKSKSASWKLFFITAGYQLVTLLVGAWILSAF